MHLISWNIDSLNVTLASDLACARLTHSILNTIKGKDPDIIATQEAKLRATGPTRKHQEILIEMFSDYDYVWRSSEEPARKGYAGTMFLYKNALTPEVTKPVIGTPEPTDHGGRILTLEFDNYYIIQVYTPNSGNELKRLDDRQVWDEKCTRYLQKLDQVKPVTANGDYNVVHTPIDLKHPEGNHHNAGFTGEERQDFGKLFKLGFADAFGKIHDNVEGVYFWWAQRVGTSKADNSGWRVGYYIVSNRITSQIAKSEVLDTGEQRDHCPVILEINL